MTGRLPERAGFFELAHRLERSGRDAPPIGGTGPARLETVRFRPHLSFDFPVRDIEQVEVLPATDHHTERWRITATFMGLYGTETPLPRHYTSRLLTDEPHEQAPVRAFLDIFHHRAFGLLYRAWKKYRYHVGYRGGGDTLDALSERLLALLGYGTPGLQQRAAIDCNTPPVRLLRYGGLLTQRPRSAAVIRGVLQDFFADVPVRIRQCVARTIRIPPASRTHLGANVPAAGRHLGRDTVCGVRKQDRSSRFRVRIGPLDYASYQAFLPGTKRRRALDELVRRTAPGHLTHDVELTLIGSEVPPLRLSRTSKNRLGWTSWNARVRGPDRSVIYGPIARTTPTAA